MLPVLTAEDVRRQDAAAEAAGTSIETLMERAGFAVARSVRGMIGRSYGVRVVVVCGKGNNAGDGFVAGRYLSAWGSRVTAVCVLGESFQGATSANRSRFPGQVALPADLDRELARADVVVDALFGIGLSRAPEGDAARAIASVNASGVPVVSVDVPSGMNADTGTCPGAAIVPDGIVTFGGMKAGLCFNEALAEWIEIADIGLPPERQSGAAVALDAGDVRSILPVRAAGTHKRRAGTVLIVAGSRAMPGAAVLAASASVHAGAGLTTLAATPSVTSIAIARTPEMTTIPLPESPEGTLDEKAVEIISSRADEFGAIAIGPGLTRHPAAADAVRALVASTRVPVVLDADGINAFAGDASSLRSRSGFLVATPHEGELARLTGNDATAIRADRLRAARDAAAGTGHAVVLKGPGTIVTAPASPLYVNLTGNRGLAQGGTGDVLTGMVASLLAQMGDDADDAGRVAVVAAAVWLHGHVADRVAERLAPHPSNAAALIDELPAAIHGLFA